MDKWRLWMVDLNRLKVFYQVYRSSGVSKAAKQLHISQPAVSQHLRKLEQEIGVILFTRVHKKLIPTGAGQQLYQGVENFFEQLPEKLEELRYPMDIPHGLLKIGAPYEFGREYLPTICHGYRMNYSDVTFRVRLGEPVPTLDLLEKGEIDFAVIDSVLATNFFGTKTDFYSIDPLIDEEVILICSREYYEKHVNGDHSFENLQKLDFISDEHDSSYLQHWFGHHYDQQRVDVKVAMMVENHQASLHCVRLGMGLTVTSHHLVWEDIRQGNVIPVTTEVKNAKNTISLIQLQDKKPTVTEKSFHTFLKKEMKSDVMLKRFHAERVGNCS